MKIENQGIESRPPSPQAAPLRAERAAGVGRSPDWWRELPAAEKRVIRDVLGAIRKWKQSESWPAAQAARKWERSIACFIKFRLRGEAGQGGKRREGKTDGCE